MIHFFGILQPAFPPSDGDSEAPFKRRSFGEAMFSSALADEALSPAERDSLVLAGKAPIGTSERDAEDRRFVRIAFPPYL
ncbi:hypothetical protein [Devosia sp.]|uniref:hypothetical protein n=1 Tax=Devosia sp. TaxID=1871048 RepID=UPI003263BDBD